MSRPLLALLLSCPDFFGQFKEQLVTSQSADRQPMLRDALERLVDGVEHNLQPKNRDHFTKNLYSFVRTVRS
jgi:exportin-7